MRKNIYKIVCLLVLICIGVSSILLIRSNKSVYATNTSVPNQYCLRDDYILYTQNQQMNGVCWTFASNMALTTTLMKKTNEYIDYSEAWVTTVFDRMEYKVKTIDENDELVEKDYVVGNGNIASAYSKWLTSSTYKDYQGLVLQSDFDYEKLYLENSDNVDSFYDVYKNHMDTSIIEDITSVTFTKDQKDEIKQHIKNHGAVVINAYWSDYIIRTAETTQEKLTNGAGVKKPGYRNNENVSLQPHAIAIIGWDDEITQTYNGKTYTGAWIILNSWGDYYEYSSNGTQYLFYEDEDIFNSNEGKIYGYKYEPKTQTSNSDLFYNDKIISGYDYTTNLKGKYYGDCIGEEQQTQQKNVFFENDLNVTYEYNISEDTDIKVYLLDIYNHVLLHSDNYLHLGTTEGILLNEQDKIFSIKVNDLPVGTYKIVVEVSNSTGSKKHINPVYICDGCEFGTLQISFFDGDVIENGYYQASNTYNFNNVDENGNLHFDFYISNYSNYPELLDTIPLNKFYGSYINIEPTAYSTIKEDYQIRVTDERISDTTLYALSYSNPADNPKLNKDQWLSTEGMYLNSNKDTDVCHLFFNYINTNTGLEAEKSIIINFHKIETKKNTTKIIYNLHDGEYTEKRIIDDNGMVELSNPTAYNRVFEGWYYDANYQNPVEKVESSTGKTYKIDTNYILDTSSNNSYYKTYASVYNDLFYSESKTLMLHAKWSDEIVSSNASIEPSITNTSIMAGNSVQYTLTDYEISNNYENYASVQNVAWYINGQLVDTLTGSTSSQITFSQTGDYEICAIVAYQVGNNQIFTKTNTLSLNVRDAVWEGPEITYTLQADSNLQTDCEYNKDGYQLNAVIDQTIDTSKYQVQYQWKKYSEQGELLNEFDISTNSSIKVYSNSDNGKYTCDVILKDIENNISKTFEITNSSNWITVSIKIFEVVANSNTNFTIPYVAGFNYRAEIEFIYPSQTSTNTYVFTSDDKIVENENTYYYFDLLQYMKEKNIEIKNFDVVVKIYSSDSINDTLLLTSEQVELTSVSFTNVDNTTQTDKKYFDKNSEIKLLNACNQAGYTYSLYEDEDMTIPFAIENVNELTTNHISLYIKWEIDVDSEVFEISENKNIEDFDYTQDYEISVTPNFKTEVGGEQVDIEGLEVTSYQWYKINKTIGENGEEIEYSTKIKDATNSNYSILNPSDRGTYYCEVVLQNADKNITKTVKLNNIQVNIEKIEITIDTSWYTGNNKVIYTYTGEEQTIKTGTIIKNADEQTVYSDFDNQPLNLKLYYKIDGKEVGDLKFINVPEFNDSYEEENVNGGVYKLKIFVQDDPNYKDVQAFVYIYVNRAESGAELIKDWQTIEFGSSTGYKSEYKLPAHNKEQTNGYFGGEDVSNLQVGTYTRQIILDQTRNFNRAVLETTIVIVPAKIVIVIDSKSSLLFTKQKSLTYQIPYEEDRILLEKYYPDNIEKGLGLQLHCKIDTSKFGASSDITLTWQNTNFIITFQKGTYSVSVTLYIVIACLLVLVISALVVLVFKRRYIYEFDTNGGLSVTPIDTKNKSKIVLPTPVKDDHKFLGWYTDQGLRKKFEGNFVKSKGKTLYAKWESLQPEIINELKTDEQVDEYVKNLGDVIVPQDKRDSLRELIEREQKLKQEKLRKEQELKDQEKLQEQKIKQRELEDLIERASLMPNQNELSLNEIEQLVNDVTNNSNKD